MLAAQCARSAHGWVLAGGARRVQARGMLELEGIRDALYRQIRQLRGDVPRELRKWNKAGGRVLRGLTLRREAEIAVAAAAAVWSISGVTS